MSIKFSIKFQFFQLRDIKYCAVRSERSESWKLIGIIILMKLNMLVIGIFKIKIVIINMEELNELRIINLINSSLFDVLLFIDVILQLEILSLMLFVMIFSCCLNLEPFSPPRAIHSSNSCQIRRLEERGWWTFEVCTHQPEFVRSSMFKFLSSIESRVRGMINVNKWAELMALGIFICH